VKSLKVRVWDIRVNRLDDTGRRKSYTVRWMVGGREKSGTFASRALADNHRSKLLQAVSRGEEFDRVSGLPASMVEVEEVSLLAFARRYAAMKWPHLSAKSRDSMSDGLATVVPALVQEMAGRPEAVTLRRALRTFALLPVERRGESVPEVASALRWLERASVPLGELREARSVRVVLDALALQLDGSPVAATTFRRKRAVFYNLLEYAVELEELPANPLDRVKSSRKRIAEAVDRRVVVNPRQARELLAAVTYVGRRGGGGRGDRLRGFFACLYFGALRPAEALGLREDDCKLPEEGWGLLTLVRSRPQAAKRWTDSGETYDERALKHRAEEEPRYVPAPPELVAILRQHLERYGAAEDGRLFRSTNGGVVAASSYSRVWQEARTYGLTPAQVASPMAARPYDLRHAAVSLWLNGGVPATEVAARAGHSVDVLLKVYATCIDGQAELVNRRIEAALAA
jgi:integrase